MITLQDCNRTCSITDLKDYSVTFARDLKWLELAKGTDKKVMILTPEDLEVDESQYPPEVRFIRTNYVDYYFAQLHNKFYMDASPDVNVLAFSAVVHKTVEVAEGIHVSIGPNNARIQLKHMGNAVFMERSRVGPLTFIQRACLQECSTILRPGALVDGYCTIGHNVIIGEESVVAAGSVVGAGSIIGKNCLLGIHTIVRPHTNICDHVVVGIGSVVIKDITKPGIYFGSPAVFKKDIDSNWMW